MFAYSHNKPRRIGHQRSMSALIVPWFAYSQWTFAFSWFNFFFFSLWNHLIVYASLNVLLKYKFCSCHKEGKRYIIEVLFSCEYVLQFKEQSYLLAIYLSLTIDIASFYKDDILILKLTRLNYNYYFTSSTIFAYLCVLLYR